MNRTYLTPGWLLVILVLLLGGLSLAPGNSHAYPNPQTNSASLEVVPSTVIPNQIFVLTGEDFTWGQGVTIDDITIDNIVLTPNKISSGTRINVDSSGKFIATILVPINTSTLTPGTHTLRATDSVGRQSGVSFTVAAPTVSITPSDSAVGTEITVTGAGFPASTGRIGADVAPLVNIEYAIENGISRIMATAQPDTKGAFTAKFKVPLKAPVPST